MNNEITQELIRSLFDYKDGELYWKVQKAHRNKIGDKAGYLNKDTNYYLVGINNKRHKLHRLIFLYHYGYLPKYIDHIDNDPLNNKIENLRSITKSQNAMNQKPKSGSSQYKGVHWNKQNKKWVSRIKINGKKKFHLGSFNLEEDAAKAYNKAAIELFGEYAKLNEVK